MNNPSGKPVRTNIPVDSTPTDDGNVSVDPDEAIRRRLAELRTDEACSSGFCFNLVSFIPSSFSSFFWPYTSTLEDT